MTVDLTDQMCLLDSMLEKTLATQEVAVESMHETLLQTMQRYLDSVNRYKNTLNERECLHIKIEAIAEALCEDESLDG